MREIASAAGAAVVDVHSDAFHNRSVFTLVGHQPDVEEAALSLGRRALQLLDLRRHAGVHPRLGVVDVVPFVPLVANREPGRFALALEARQGFARAFSSLGVPCFYYGVERALPEVRRRAFKDLLPDVGPTEPHPTAGACCVGVRDFLVAYNLVVDAPLERAKEISEHLRRPEVRALGLGLGDEAQVSMNLVAPEIVGPEQVYDEVAEMATVLRAELVGLIPKSVLMAVAEERWEALDLSLDKTIEAALGSRYRTR